MRQHKAICALRSWEFAVVGACVTTQVAGWQRVHMHGNHREKDSQIKFRISAKQRPSLRQGFGGKKPQMHKGSKILKVKIINENQ